MPNAPDQPGATTSALFTQQTPGAIITGAGNLDHPAGASLFEITDATSSELGTVVLHARTQGAELDYGSMMLRYDSGLGIETLAPVARLELDRFDHSPGNCDRGGPAGGNAILAPEAAQSRAGRVAGFLQASNHLASSGGRPVERFCQPFGRRPRPAPWRYTNLLFKLRSSFFSRAPTRCLAR